MTPLLYTKQQVVNDKYFASPYSSLDFRRVTVIHRKHCVFEK